MSDEIPSPAQRPVQTRAPERDGLAPLPWQGALLSAVSAMEADLNACRAENAQLRSENTQLRARLAKGRIWARTTAENWKLRQQAWHRERDELLARLAEHGRRQ